MPKRYYKINIDQDTEIRVFFETAKGILINYAVRLFIRIHGKFYEVVRFDSGHSCPHKDILDIEGNVARKIWFEFLDYKQAMSMAVRDLKDNHNIYKERFLRWMGTKD